jgi:hypothetical protein
MQVDGEVEVPEIGRFTWSIRAYAWELPLVSATAIDATTVIRAEARGSERTVQALCHSKLAAASRGAWRYPLDDNAIVETIQQAYSDVWVDEPARSRVWLHDYGIASVARTVAPRYWECEGDIVPILGPRVTAESWMQDWPLDVSDPELLGPACDAYDRATDDQIRFTLMAVALWSYEEVLRRRGADDHARIAWLADRLHASFALHGHQVHRFACWSTDESDLRPLERAMRDVWHRSRHAIQLGAE